MATRAAPIDEMMMRRALTLARKGEGFVEPNPMVGCVISHGERILGEGYHRRFGDAHAEVAALQRCHTAPRGATAYVTLEPCCHQGKTPPCCDALIEAGIRNVVVPMRDPNTLVAGKGLRRLRAAGIEVVTGVCRKEAEELMAAYLTRLRLGRPYVIAKWAQSVDGKLATHTGDSKWISCAQSRKTVHRLRARVDGILVGSGTLMKDDPLLTARNVPIRRTALRIVLDARLRVPVNSRLVQTSKAIPTAIFTARQQASSRKADRLRMCGCEVLAARVVRSGTRTARTSQRLDLPEILHKLGEQQLTNLLVEGGPTMLSSFFAQQLVDEALVFTAPIVVGGNDAPSVDFGSGSATILDAQNTCSVSVRRSGDDLLHQLRFTNRP